MNNNTKRLIQAVAENDFIKAKQFAKIIVENDNTKVNKAFCNTIKYKLQASSLNFMELPHDIKGIIHMEDVSMSFNENRYYLSDREQHIVNEITGMYETSKKLTEMGIHYLNSLMLYGESGTGKTLLGKYIAYKLKLPFIYMNFSNVLSSYLGSTSKNIHKAFSFVENQKAIFMIDEVDAIGMQRGREDIGEMARITISLMQALDMINNDTIVIGATNRIDMIDEALLRRFAITHKVDKFTNEEKEKMIIKFLNDVSIDYDEEDIREYSKNNYSQARIINEVVRAIALSIRTGNEFKIKF